MSLCPPMRLTWYSKTAGLSCRMPKKHGYFKARLIKTRRFPNNAPTLIGLYFLVSLSLEEYGCMTFYKAQYAYHERKRRKIFKWPKTETASTTTMQRTTKYSLTVLLSYNTLFNWITVRIIMPLTALYIIWAKLRGHLVLPKGIPVFVRIEAVIN